MLRVGERAQLLEHGEPVVAVGADAEAVGGLERWYAVAEEALRERAHANAHAARRERVERRSRRERAVHGGHVRRATVAAGRRRVVGVVHGAQRAQEELARRHALDGATVVNLLGLLFLQTPRMLL